MSDLKDLFEQKSQEVTQLSSAPGNDTMLKLYALFKQGTKGDVDSKRPGMMNMVGRAKWDAWNSNKGMSSDDAMQAYVDIVQGLQDAE